MKPKKIIQSEIEPPKEDLWLDKENNLKAFGPKGWEEISSKEKGSSEAKSIIYDNSISKIPANNVQEAIDKNSKEIAKVEANSNELKQKVNVLMGKAELVNVQAENVGYGTSNAKNALDSLLKDGESKEPIDMTPLQDGTLSQHLGWSIGSGKCYMMRVNSGDKFEIICRSGNITRYAWLKYNTIEDGTYATPAVSGSIATNLDAGSTSIIEAPKDCYLYVSSKTFSGAEQSPLSLSKIVYNEGYIRRINDRLSYLEGISVYNKNADFGVPSTDFYECGNEDFTFGTQHTSTNRIYQEFDTLVGDYIAKKNIGTASDGSTMYSYTATPLQPINEKRDGGYDLPKNRYKIIIVCGQHGIEKNSIYSTYYLLKELKNNYQSSDILRYIRSTIELIVIPCSNPYGIDMVEYKNYNGVNLNRNWGVENWVASVTDPTSSQYQGESAFDQLETQNIRDVIIDNTDAMFVIDYHNNGGVNVTTKADINWVSVKGMPNTDRYTKNMLTATMCHLRTFSNYLNAKYPQLVGEGNNPCGRMDNTSIPSTIGYLASYAVEHNILGCTFEGCVGLPTEETSYSDTAKKINTELITNFIATISYYFSKLA